MGPLRLAGQATAQSKLPYTRRTADRVTITKTWAGPGFTYTGAGGKVGHHLGTASSLGEQVRRARTHSNTTKHHRSNYRAIMSTIFIGPEAQ